MPDKLTKANLKVLDISFNNFKPFGKKLQKFSKKPITLIYGPNSIGKSSLIHLLAYHHNGLFKGEFDTIELDEFGDTISLGGFKEFVHKKKENTTLKLAYTFDKLMVQSHDKYYKEAKLIIDVGIPAKEKKAKDLKIQYIFDDEKFIDIVYTNEGYYEAKPNIEHPTIQKWIDEISNVYENWDKDEFDGALNLKKPIKFPLKDLFNDSFIKNISSFDAKIKNKPDWIKEDYLYNWKPEQEAKKLKIKDIKEAGNDFEDLNESHTALKESQTLSLRSILCHFALDAIFSIHTQMQKMDEAAKGYFTNFSYIGPLRFYPQREENKYSDNKKNNIYQKLKENNKLRDDLNKWFKNEKLNLPYEIVVKKYHDIDKIVDEEGKIREHLTSESADIEELLFKDTRTDTLVHNREMGLGITQILPVLVETLEKKSTTIAIEQPELHLHPALQMEIADEFIRSYKEQNNHFIIETHSEHLLLRIMKRMRYFHEDKEGRDETLDLTPEHICLLYVDNNGEFTYINELELDKDGSLLDPWPNGFFEEGFNERFD